jgi:hypothetical protein
MAQIERSFSNSRYTVWDSYRSQVIHIIARKCRNMLYPITKNKGSDLGMGIREAIFGYERKISAALSIPSNAC